MSKNKILIILNPLLAITAVIQIISGMLTAWLPAEINYQLTTGLHEITGIILTILIAAHIALNFNWIKSKLKIFHKKSK